MQSNRSRCPYCEDACAFAIVKEQCLTTGEIAKQWYTKFVDSEHWRPNIVGEDCRTRSYTESANAWMMDNLSHNFQWIWQKNWQKREGGVRKVLFVKLTIWSKFSVVQLEREPASSLQKKHIKRKSILGKRRNIKYVMVANFMEDRIHHACYSRSFLWFLWFLWFSWFVILLRFAIVCTRNIKASHDTEL